MTRLLTPPLEWATFSARPLGIGPARHHRGPRRRGLQYENLLAKQLPYATHGQWIKYTDAEGTFYCQPDFILPIYSRALVIECKLSWTPDATTQLGLYVPVVEAATGRKAFGLTVTRSIKTSPGHYTVCGALEDAVGAALYGQPTILHWLGNASQLALRSRAA